jgi:hypothetical protein
LYIRCHAARSRSADTADVAHGIQEGHIHDSELKRQEKDYHTDAENAWGGWERCSLYQMGPLVEVWMQVKVEQGENLQLFLKSYQL